MTYCGHFQLDYTVAILPNGLQEIAKQAQNLQNKHLADSFLMSHLLTWQ